MLLLLCFTRSSHAEQVASELEKGVSLYKKGSFADAELMLKAATQTGATPRDRALAWLYLGLAQAAQDKTDLARRSFVRQLELDPELSPDELRTPPKILRDWKSIVKKARGNLNVAASEPGALIFIDGRRVGTAPSKIKLPVGRHTVEIVSRDGVRGLRVPILMRAGALGRIHAELRPGWLPRGSGAVRFVIAPSSAQVYDDAKPIGTADSLLTFPSGPRLLTFAAPGYRTATKEVVFGRGRVTTFELELTPTRRPWYKKRRTWAWVSFGFAGATALAGAFLGRAGQDSMAQAHSGQRDATIDYDSFRQLASDADTKARWANVCFGFAGAAVVTGIVFLAVGDRTLRVSSDGRGMVLAGRF